jgi:hypothetical protein
MAEIQVTSWGTREPLPNDPGAPMHDCLWEIAQEQAVLDRMKTQSETWETASTKVSQQDIRKQLDTVCDDNGFRRLDGSGNGRNPNLIYDGEHIKVRIDPAQLDKPANGVTNNTASQGAYNKAVAGDGGKGVDLNKKNAVDTWIGTVPGFPNLSESTKASLITAYDVPGMNRDNLAKLGSSAAFRSLDEKQQQQLLAVYGSKDKSFATGEVDKIVANPGEDGNQRLKVIGSQGFFRMEEGAQKNFVNRYGHDKEFTAAVNQIVGQENYTGKNSTEQAHALDVLNRYAGRKHEGYGEVSTDKRTSVLITLYNEVLSTDKFNLNTYGKGDKPENDDQKKQLDDYAQNRASEVGATKEPAPTTSQTPKDDGTD